LEQVPTRRLNATVDSEEHAKLLFNLQLLRGSAYREYQPLATGLTPDGRHIQLIDNESWHILLQGQNGHVIGCARSALLVEVISMSGPDTQRSLNPSHLELLCVERLRTIFDVPVQQKWSTGKSARGLYVLTCAVLPLQ
jgi:hypothetical protein